MTPALKSFIDSLKRTIICRPKPSAIDEQAAHQAPLKQVEPDPEQEPTSHRPEPVSKPPEPEPEPEPALPDVPEVSESELEPDEPQSELDSSEPEPGEPVADQEPVQQKPAAEPKHEPESECDLQPLKSKPASAKSTKSYFLQESPNCSSPTNFILPIMAMGHESANLRAVVDMGSNGIRFSISDLNPKTARVLPTVYQDRLGVSLYDAQYSSGKKGPIPDDIVNKVIKELIRFKRICHDFNVPDTNVRIIATEATRTAYNSEEYCRAIEHATKWRVDMLPKEEEGRIGAMGVASSFSSVRGLVMDLGGGSTQLTWLIMERGQINMNPKGSISLPYGAAALTQRINEAKKQGDAAIELLGNEVTDNLKKAVSDLEIPDELLETADAEGGLRLYLSGGGFRGWGYILMSIHDIQPYPIPVINGFSVPVASFSPDDVLRKAEPQSSDKKIFRVSKRRASQVPAVSFLIDSLLNALPRISHIHFAQGGVREGVHFSSFTEEMQALHPLNAATSSYAPHSALVLVKLLRLGIPSEHFSEPDDAFAPYIPEFLAHDDIIILSLIHLINNHAKLPKDSRSAAGLRSTTSGILAGVHGLSHKSRALLGLALCKRWGGEIAPADEPFYDGLIRLVGPYDAWWAEYIGILSAAIGAAYPAGIVTDERPWITAKWHERDPCKHGRDKIEILIEVNSDVDTGDISEWVGDLEKLGKKKHWLQGEGVRTKVQVYKTPSR